MKKQMLACSLLVASFCSHAGFGVGSSSEGGFLLSSNPGAFSMHFSFAGENAYNQAGVAYNFNNDTMFTPKLGGVYYYNITSDELDEPDDSGLALTLGVEVELGDFFVDVGYVPEIENTYFSVGIIF